MKLKIYSKSIKKLVVIQYYNEFKEAIKSVSEDVYLKNKIYELNKQGINQIYLPKEFESIVHRNISINVLVKLNIDLIFNALCKVFDKKFKEGKSFKEELLNTANKIKFDFINNKKSEVEPDNSIYTIVTEKSKKLSSITCYLLEKTWPIIEKYFPLEEYGFPTKNFYNSLFSLILNKSFLPETEIYFHENHDVYGLEIILENEILKEIIHDHNINLSKELIERGYCERSLALSDILDKTKVGYIRVEPITVSKNLEDEGNKIFTSMNNTFFKVQDQFNEEYKKEIEPIQDLAHLYVDLVFNKKMDFYKIRTYIRKSCSSYAGKGDTQIKKDIQYIAEIADLEITDKSLKKKRK